MASSEEDGASVRICKHLGGNSGIFSLLYKINLSYSFVIRQSTDFADLVFKCSDSFYQHPNRIRDV